MDHTGIYVWVGLFTIALGYELFSVAKGTQKLSNAAWEMISGRPFIPFLTGFLCGHFFWQAKP